MRSREERGMSDLSAAIERLSNKALWLTDEEMSDLRLVLDAASLVAGGVESRSQIRRLMVQINDTERGGK